jgi:hypothetical protein
MTPEIVDVVVYGESGVIYDRKLEATVSLVFRFYAARFGVPDLPPGLTRIYTQRAQGEELIAARNHTSADFWHSAINGSRGRIVVSSR